MATSAKFRLTGVKRYETQQWIYSKEHPHGEVPSEPVQVADLEFSAVGRSDDPNDENNYFFASTPSGSIKLSVVNPVAVAELLDGIGKEFYVTFNIAPGQESKKTRVHTTLEMTSQG